MDIEKLALDYIASLGVTEHARADAIKQGFIAGFIRGMNESGQPIDCESKDSPSTSNPN